MTWFAGIDTDWNSWEFGVAGAWYRDDWCGLRLMLGPWSACVGMERRA